MAFFNFSFRIFVRTSWGVMPSTLGCLIPAHRNTHSENDMGRPGRARSVTLTHLGKAVLRSFASDLRSRKTSSAWHASEVTHERVHASGKAKGKGVVR